MVKITNAFGDVKRGKQGEAVYQEHYGHQIRRTLKVKKNADTPTQRDQRARFKEGIDFAQGLTKPQRDFIKSYMAEAGITAPDGLPTTWFSFAKKIAMTVPKVAMEIETDAIIFPTAYEDWGFRKPITFYNAGVALPNYQALITLTPANFDYAKCNADGSDIRFATSDNITLLPYWIEDWNYNGNSKIWVKVDNVPGGGSTIYIYYDNGSAEDESNGENTFIFFDDFNRADNGPGAKWTVFYGAWNVISNTLRGILGGTFPSYFNAIKAGTDRQDYIYEFKSNVNIVDNQRMAASFRHQTDNSNFFFMHTSGGGYFFCYRGGLNWFGPSGFMTGTPPGWHDYTIKVKGPSGAVNVKLDIDGVNKFNSTYTGASNNAGKIGFGGQNNTFYFDNARVREYADPEPSSELREEETPATFSILKSFTIRHPAIKSFEILGTDYKEEGLSNLTNNISTSFARQYHSLDATAIKVVTLAEQEYIFPVQ